MHIDWITVSAQIFNFMVLVALLKHFLYQPVTAAMQRREQTIAEHLEEARSREEEAQRKSALYDQKQEEIEERREALLAEAREEAGHMRREMLADVRAEVDRISENWKQQVEDEKREFLLKLGRESSAVVQRALRRALSDLASAKLEEQIIHAFVERVKGLEPSARKAILGDADFVSIHSAFELESAARSRLTRVIHEYIRDGLRVEYELRPELVCGIELRGGERRVSWNVSSYLETLATQLREALGSDEAAVEGG